MSPEPIRLNGIDGVTGRPLTELLLEDAAALARRDPPTDRRLRGWLKRLWKGLTGQLLAWPDSLHLDRASEAGWGVVFAADTPPAVRAALEPLAENRRRQTAPDRWKGGAEAFDYRPGEGWRQWLQRHKVDTGGPKVDRVPYYLLLVGDPGAIPFAFQYGLGLEYAVGRLAFDHAEEYGRYARAVVAYETAPPGSVSNAKEVVYWATRHEGDQATEMSAEHLVPALARRRPGPEGGPVESPVAEEVGFRQSVFIGADATKDKLVGVLQQVERPPALLFAAAHGLGWDPDDPIHLSAQGALLCQEGTTYGPKQPGQYLAAADVADAARVFGMVVFLFACFSAGTPEFDTFDRRATRRRLAYKPFVSRLPQRLLSHPGGGALAVFGHIDQASGYSIGPLELVGNRFRLAEGVGAQTEPFRNLIHRILAGKPVGYAHKCLTDKYGCLIKVLQDKLDRTQAGPPPTDADLGLAWLERNDFQNYILLGDPAVRLRVDLLA